MALVDKQRQLSVCSDGARRAAIALVDKQRQLLACSDSARRAAMALASNGDSCQHAAIALVEQAATAVSMQR
jgi:hypothetical protein